MLQSIYTTSTIKIPQSINLDLSPFFATPQLPWVPPASALRKAPGAAEMKKQLSAWTSVEIIWYQKMLFCISKSVKNVMITNFWCPSFLKGKKKLHSKLFSRQPSAKSIQVDDSGNSKPPQGCHNIPGQSTALVAWLLGWQKLPPFLVIQIWFKIHWIWGQSFLGVWNA